MTKLDMQINTTLARILNASLLKNTVLYTNFDLLCYIYKSARCNNVENLNMKPQHH